MSPDLPTLLWALGITSGVLAVSVLYANWRVGAHDGLAAWGVALLLNGLSYPAYSLRLFGWPALSIASYNLALSGSLAMCAYALQRFQAGRARPVPAWMIWSPVLVCLLLAHVLAERHGLRVALLSLVLFLQAGLLLWLAVCPGLRGARERSRELPIAGASLLMLLLLVRAAMAVHSDDWTGASIVPEGIQAVTFLVGMSVLVLNTLGYVLMQKERAIEVQHQQATHDVLTGVANRRALMEEVERVVSLASRQHAPLSLLMCDIDFFKRVNDEHGHLVGDEVLREVARRIGHRLRLHDTLGRYGGEEFLVVLPDTGADAAVAVAEAIRRAIAELPVEALGRRIAVTISIGVHTHRPDAVPESVDRMVDLSDQALYAAKQRGRNRVERSTSLAASEAAGPRSQRDAASGGQP